jgi:hypothetical protein
MARRPWIADARRISRMSADGGEDYGREAQLLSLKAIMREMSVMSTKPSGGSRAMS